MKWEGPITLPPFDIQAEGQPITDWSIDGNRYTHDETGLRVEILSTRHGPATEYTTFLANQTNDPSPLVTRVIFFRQAWPIGVDTVPVIHHGGGGLTDAVFPGTAWRIYRSELTDWSSLQLEGARGRSSNRDLPIFAVTDEDDTEGRIFVAGYSGHVVNTVTRSVDYRGVSVESRIHELQVRLPPQARVRLGSMLVLPYQGDIDTGRNLLRRTLRDHICPPAPAGRVRPEVTYVHWFGIQQDYTADRLLKEADVQERLGTEVFELDAAWAAQGTHRHYGAGNWAVENREKFPDGIRTFADRIRAKGMRFGLWFEPETVEAGTEIHGRHPEWLLMRDGEYRHLLDFGHPQAQTFITDLVSGIYRAYGVQWSRMDSNLDLDKYFAAISDPGERGYRELRHWEGWYRFLDTLLERHPDLHLEGCSSGGRRIDLEMLKRSHSFWISDNTSFAPTVRQHIGGANHWLPTHLLNMEAVKYPLFERHVRSYSDVGDETFSDYWLIALMGGLFGLGGPHTAYPATVNDKFARFIAKYKAVRHLLNGDFHPLQPQPTHGTDWDAWQFHEPGSGNGLLMVFRMRGRRRSLKIHPRAVPADARYRLDMFPSGQHSKGRRLADGLTVRLDAPMSAILIQYTREQTETGGCPATS